MRNSNSRWHGMRSRRWSKQTHAPLFFGFACQLSCGWKWSWLGPCAQCKTRQSKRNAESDKAKSIGGHKVNKISIGGQIRKTLTNAILTCFTYPPVFFYFPIKTLFFSQKITCEEGSWEKEKKKKNRERERERERERKMGVEEGGAM